MGQVTSMSRMNLVLMFVAVFSSVCCIHARRCYEVQERKALYAYNDKTIEDQTMESCQQLCDLETEFTCISLDLTSSGTCHLSQESHVTDPDMFGSHHAATYAAVAEGSVGCGSEEDKSSEANDGKRQCYEVQEGKALYGNNYKKIGDQTMESCQRLCDLETEFTCISLDLTSFGTCYLNRESHVTDPYMFGSFPGYTYAAVVECTGSGSDSSEENDINEDGDEEGFQDEGRCYEVQEGNALYGHNDKTIGDQTMESCQRLCDLETEFTCISLDLTSFGTCHLSRESHVTEKNSYMFGSFPGYTYAAVVECTGLGSDSSEENDINEDGDKEGFQDEGRCYQVQEDKALYGHNDKTIDEQTMEGCQRLCDLETEFTCISLDLTSFGMCHLSQESHVTDSYMFGSFPGVTYAAVVECTGSGSDSSEENDINQDGAEEGGQDEGVTCTDTGHYQDDTCYHLFDGDLDTWWQIPHAYSGDSATIRFPLPRVISSIDVWSHTLTMGQCSVLEFEMTSFMKTVYRDCHETNSATSDRFLMPNVRTDYVTMTCVERCPNVLSGWYLFAEIEFNAYDDDDYDDDEDYDDEDDLDSSGWSSGNGSGSGVDGEDGIWFYRDLVRSNAPLRIRQILERFQSGKKN